jgi:hypothetical protein
VDEKRKFPRFAATTPAICSRYGKQMTMRTLNISLGGLELEANFDLEVGESIDLVIVTNDIRIRCSGRVVAIEEFKNKVHARLRFTPSSHLEFRKLSEYLDTISGSKRISFQKWIIWGMFILSAYVVYLIIRTYFLR